MTVEKLNPDAPIFSQIDGQWQKLMTILLWKLTEQKKISHKGVEITADDLLRFGEVHQRGDAILLTHGQFDRIVFKIVTMEEGKKIAEHQKTQEGHA